MPDTRTRIIEHLQAASAPFACFIAPAGYGKTYLAHAYAATFARSVNVEAQGGMAAADVLHEVVTGLDAISASWDRDGQATCIVLDAVERLDDAALEEVLDAMVRLRPSNGAVVVCTRREPLAFKLSDCIEPHLLVVFRRDDIALTLEELKAKVSPGALDAKTFYAIHYLTLGWPVVALYVVRAAVRGAFEQDPLRIGHPALNDILDWIDTNAMRTLPAELRDMLIYCIACGDVRPSDFDELYAENNARPDIMLCRNAQRADIGFTGEIRVHPMLRFFIHARYASDLELEARSAARDLLDQGNPVRAARALLTIGDFKGAADILDAVEFEKAMECGSYAYPGMTLEFFNPIKPPYALYPMLWLSLIPCRRYVESPSVLAREGADILELHVTKTSARARLWIVASVSMLFAEGGDLESARRYREQLDRMEPTGESDDLELETVREIASMYLDIQRGQFVSARDRWRKNGPRLARYPTLYALHLRVAMRIATATGEYASGEEPLRMLLSFSHLGGCASLAASGGLEATFVAWLKNDEANFTLQRSEFARLVRSYDVPALWRCLAAFFGNDLHPGMPADPFADARAVLILAVDCEDERSVHLAQRVVDISRDAWNPVVRIGARMVGYLRELPGREALLREAVEIAQATDSERIRAAVSAFVDGEPGFDVIRRLRDRMARTQLQAPAPPPQTSQAIIIDLASGEVSRAGSRVRVSEGTLELLALLAVRAHPVKREVLVDRLWPDLDAVSANNALKMCVRRARLQLGTADAIVTSQSAYCLGSAAVSTFERITALGQATFDLPLSDGQRSELADTFARLLRGQRSGWAPWEWFVSIGRQLLEAMRHIGAHLIADACERGEFQRALLVAREMAEVDPIDEYARTRIIQVYLKMNNWGSAVQEFREYSALLKRELGEEPSEELRRLVDAC